MSRPTQLAQNFGKYASFFSTDELKQSYLTMLKPRRLELRMLKWLRLGKISKWFAGIGQEAISAGIGLELNSDDHIMTMHRNLGIFLHRGIPVWRLFAQWQGKKEGFTQGRDRSYHFGSAEHRISGMISHLGPQLGVACGVALAYKLRREQKVAVVFCGDGTSSQGDVHEAMNLAAVWELPVLFVIENNTYALSTHSDQQFVGESLAHRAASYGMEGHCVDGNNILEVRYTVRNLLEDLRAVYKPAVLECMTFRRRGHEETSGTSYVPDALMDHWEQRDPLHNYEEWLEEHSIMSDQELARYQSETDKMISEELKKGEECTGPEINSRKELDEMYAPFALPISSENDAAKREMRLIDAVHQALDMALEKHKDLVFMGQDIADFGGVFKATEGMLEKFGAARIRNTPLCESAVISAALGLSVKGIPSMVELQFADFVSTGFTAIVNNLAKVHYRWGQNANVVLRMPTGAGVGAGPFHSQSNEAWFTHTPGLKVLYPSTPEDAKGLLLRAFEDPNPVMFFEHKALYRSIKSEVNEDYYTLPMGKARTHHKGASLAVITYGMGVHWMKTLMQKEKFKDIELLDLRSLVPWDKEAVGAAVKKTGKVLLLQEDIQTGGFMSDISAWISEHCFEHLDAPIMHVSSLDTAVPFNGELEKSFLAQSRLEEKLRFLLDY